uniref:Uncharacterized protein n=1 Tax=Rhizophora mucronata TaxID=61149 RepID=A0A2P2LRK9_RHIMU
MQVHAVVSLHLNCNSYPWCFRLSKRLSGSKVCSSSRLRLFLQQVLVDLHDTLLVCTSCQNKKTTCVNPLKPVHV